MSDYPCIICQNGDVYSNIVCEDCEASIEYRKEVHESMVALVHVINGILGEVPRELENKIQESVKPIYNALINITIEDTRIKKEKNGQENGQSDTSNENRRT